MKGLQMTKQKANNTKGSLAEQLIKVRLSQGFPTFEVKDDVTNREVSVDKGSKSDATKFIVKLVNNSLAYKDAQFAKGQLYLHYLNVTSPWEDRGARMMLGEHALDTMDELRVLKQKADELADKFCSEEYPAIYERAVFQAGVGGNNLGSLAARVIDKYPTPDTVRSKFYNNLTIEPMGEVETLKRFGHVFTEQDMSDYEALMQQRLDQAQTDAWKKLAEPLSALINKCATATDKNMWHETVIQNVRDVVCLVERINVQNDEVLNDLAYEMTKLVGGITKDDLKHNADVRSDTHKKAKDLMERMSGYLG
jgi:hypothetical protein